MCICLINRYSEMLRFTIIMSGDFVFKLVLLSSIISITLCKPVAMVRNKRQVVQPTWLLNNGAPINFFADTRVQVNPQNLMEAAAIRASIQKAVNEGTYAVQLPNPNADQISLEVKEPVEEERIDEPTTTPRQQLPTFAPLWEFQFPPLNDTEMQANFTRDMQRAWSQFIEFTRQCCGWNNSESSKYNNHEN